MNRNENISIKKLTRLAFVSVMMIVVVALAFASKGGGGKKKTPSFKSDFVPIRTTTGFTLRTGAMYTGSHTFGIEKTDKVFSFNTVVTYQKGNTIYILPYKYKVNTTGFSAGTTKSNLQLLDLKIKMHK
jgi:hypothetical protein